MTRPTPSAAAVALAVGLLQAAAAQSGSGIRLTDISEASGLRFKHATGATGRKYLPETLGSGAAVFDADGDGRQDILLLSGTSLADDAPRKIRRCACSATAAQPASRTSRRRRA